jgi:hypothetical protein
MLLEEVSRLITNPTPERVQEELATIGLMEYVKDFLPTDWKKTGELTDSAE